MNNFTLYESKYIPRIYYSGSLKKDQKINLEKKKNHYILNVLRIKLGNIIKIFNNTNIVYIGKIINIKKNISVKIIDEKKVYQKNNINIHLGQMISKKEKMNFTIEKSVELGVNSITPIISEKSSTPFVNKNIKKKIKYWKNIIISACSQSGRNILPTLNLPKKISEFNNLIPKKTIKIVCYQNAKKKIKNIKNKGIKNFCIIIGSEKGFSKNEIEYMNKNDFFFVSLGIRILRTETAAITAINYLQVLFGNM